VNFDEAEGVVRRGSWNSGGRPPEDESFDAKPIRGTERYRKIERTANRAPVEEGGEI
jgi:hypothetical protein